MALIQEAEIDLGQGLNILTGETGAGKSIIIGAVNVALGAQSFKGFARDGADQALSELVFSVEDDKCRQRLKRSGCGPGGRPGDYLQKADRGTQH